MDCARCGAGTWACVNAGHQTLCLHCAYETRVVPPKSRPFRKQARRSVPRVCICARDEACDLCFAAKDAAYACAN